MIGDKLEIKKEYFTIAYKIVEQLFKNIGEDIESRCVVLIGGESGSGKSVTAHCLSTLLQEKGYASSIIQQDDYFKLPPQDNYEQRKKNIHSVGTNEVNLDLLQTHINDYLNFTDTIIKPLVYFNENKIEEEKIDCTPIQFLIVEGVYALKLSGSKQSIFMDRTYLETKASRQARGRDQGDTFTEEVLSLEQPIVRADRNTASMIVLKDYSLYTML